jgi:hypothetical protein
MTKLVVKNTVEILWRSARRGRVGACSWPVAGCETRLGRNRSQLSPHLLRQSFTRNRGEPPLAPHCHREVTR